MDLDAFREEAAAMASRQGLPGQILKFTQDGGWTAKENDMNGAEMVVLIESAMRGWTLWEDSRPTEYHMGLIRDRYQPPPRDALGHTDASRWRRRDQDPWQYTHGLPMIANDGALYCFTTSSVGGKDCIGGLFRAFVEHEERRGADPRTLPAVSLEKDAYPNKRGGVTAIPLFSIIRWTEPPPNLPLIAPPSSGGTLLDGKVIEHNPTDHAGLKLVESKPQNLSAFERKPFARDEIDDDIPF